MKRQVEIEGRIEQLQRQLNTYIEKKGFAGYDELLRLSQKFDRILSKWIKLKYH